LRLAVGELGYLIQAVGAVARDQLDYAVSKLLPVLLAGVVSPFETCHAVEIQVANATPLVLFAIRVLAPLPDLLKA
jgi:hypothetical protein